MKLKLYEDLSDGIIDEKEYKEYRGSFSQRIAEKEQALERLEHERTAAADGNRGGSLWLEEFKRYRNTQELNRQMLTTLVDKIIVYDGGSIEVVFRYQDEFAMLWKKIGQYQSSMETPALAMAQ